MSQVPLIEVPVSELEDLRHRIRAARWPRPWPVDGWEAGTEPGRLRRLSAYWADGFDWYAQQAAINALPSHHADLDGTAVHYLRFDGETADAVPIVLTHGWPSTVLEEVELARRLSSPSRYGRAGAPSFTAIVPALPGFPFTPEQSRMPGVPTHELWHRLMTQLGFPRYLAHGGDLGAGISTRLAQAHPESVAGIHLLAVADPEDAADLTDGERAYLGQGERWWAEEGGYEHLQRTRPLSAAYALNDSPVGLLGWLLEKYHAWTDHADGAAGLDDDLILTQVSLYWFTGAIAASFRPYWEHRVYPPGPVRVTVPTGVAVFPADLVQPPRSWPARNYHVVHYNRMPRGGHFAAREQPDLLADDIRVFAQKL
ncbi:epoxide hydrolase family protein [Catenuloplanes indicus]|uniref:Pimeloyl-ACP methyl ester carboxylesterase n=1 Tax=Catenuloplanes indicus TaxID=137267 RepID=A0AAE4B304_9ACTN|nr:epoxide hydrolase family protein [Catenuloplanes indicus]MDQ0371236.1 pimeloyl-ACP methyl ester carboxylesterase [Catenuloplanes indicus]